MKLLSICNKLYSKLTGRDVQAIQSDVISSLERELSSVKRHKEAVDAGARGIQNALSVTKRENDTLHREVRILNSRIEELMRIRNDMTKELHLANNKPDVVVTERTFVMTTEMYDKFAKSLEPPVVTNNTTAQGAGYLVGMQRVLEKLRSEYVA